MDNLKIGSKVFVHRREGNDYGTVREIEGQVYYIIEVDNNPTAKSIYLVYSTLNSIGDYIGWFSEEELELVEDKENKVIVINPTKEYKQNTVMDVALESIYIKDREFFNELEILVIYLASTYQDKYETGKNYSKEKLLSKEGKAANIFTALKYIQRYDTQGYSKSENPQDLLKAIHYCLFELQRKTKNGN